jgi:hypothetical protein
MFDDVSLFVISKTHESYIPVFSALGRPWKTLTWISSHIISGKNYCISRNFDPPTWNKYRQGKD